MKAVTLVAGLAGTVAAGHAHKHARHQARDTTSTAWTEWDPTTTTTASSSTSTAWSDWDPATSTTTTTSASTWGEWDPKTSSTTTTTASSDWGEWDPKSSSSTTSSASSGWGEWDPSTSSWTSYELVTSVVSATAAEASVCVQHVIYITGEGTWGEDEGTTSTVATTTSYTTVTVEPTADPSSVWSDWTESSSATTVTVVPTEAPSSSWSDTATYSAPSTSTSAWSSASATPSSSSGGSGTLGSSANGDTWAMTYSPYTSAGGCKDAGTVSSDIAEIAGKGFTTVRVYSTDCSTLANVGTAARANNLKLILGIFISSTGISGAQGQVSDIVNWAQWDLVELVVVGNEAVFNKYCSASDLAGFIASVRGTIGAAGYTGPVTTTEPIDTWLTSGTTFCGVVDVVAANLYAFFNAQTTADAAGPFIQAEITELEAICSGKDVYVMETGWPHAGNCNGVACPSDGNQATAINSIKNVVGAKVVFFSFEDDAWKEPGEFDVEQYWGCADVFAGN